MAFSAFKKVLTHFERPINRAKQDTSLAEPRSPHQTNLQSGTVARTNHPSERPRNDFSLTHYNENWDYARDQWSPALGAPAARHATPLNPIVIYNRRDSKRPYRDHTWIEFRSEALRELLNPHLRGFCGFTGSHLAVDARHVYLQRKVLEEVAAQPADGPANQACKELGRLLDYIKKEFDNLTTQLDAIEHESDPPVQWDLLWALFKTDSLIERLDQFSNQWTAFKLESWGYEGREHEEAHFQVYGKWLQWTGRRYVERDVSNGVVRYEGTRPINSLGIKPLTDLRRRELIERGKKYIALSEVSHRSYQSNIMWKERDLNGEITKRGRAHGRVMVDVLSFRRFVPGGDEWDSEDLSQDCEGKPDWLLDISDDDKQICLLPPIIHGWSFTAKRWGSLLVDNISNIPFNSYAFEGLVLPDEDKEIVQALVEAQVDGGNTPLFKDSIPGKGNGLVILLHGNPGTGKTLTAEAISEHLKRPLYTVSCSEFGLNLESVEQKLKEVLDITSLWKAIVLIDEVAKQMADIFLEARSEDFARNAIVGVFLRLLEYHSGIIILTTNRVRTLDRAFRSRISLAIKYQDLDAQSRLILWERFLKLAGATIQDSQNLGTSFNFSREEINKLSEREVNGRVIKHIVRVSQALAMHDKKPMNVGHVAKVWKRLDLLEKDFPSSSSESPSANTITT
ncbi:P-loop containing nucleoside triphosphate hydrolase protein [Ceratobasidium sp. AG-I]|nr:P-loop containing nucleoside triphosphate hydrolase protein [Ceratobasidium sp. AG-I]